MTRKLGKRKQPDAENAKKCKADPEVSSDESDEDIFNEVNNDADSSDSDRELEESDDEESALYNNFFANGVNVNSDDESDGEEAEDVEENGHAEGSDDSEDDSDEIAENSDDLEDDSNDSDSSQDLEEESNELEHESDDLETDSDDSEESVEPEVKPVHKTVDSVKSSKQFASKSSQNKKTQEDDNDSDAVNKKNESNTIKLKKQNVSNSSQNEKTQSAKLKKHIIPKSSLHKIQSLDSNDEYADDSSDEEDIRNTVGNIPMNWYDEYGHLGYDWDGKKILKPEQGDQLDEFLRRMEDPNFWRTVKDPQTGQSVVLSEEDINLIKRIRGQKIPDASFDDSAQWINWFSNEVMEMPLRKFPEHKRSFIPSKDEARRVSKLVHHLKMGFIKTQAELDKARLKKDPQFYMLWETDDQAEDMRRIHKHISAPKRHLPGHGESYNPPPEYLYDSKEMKHYNKDKLSQFKKRLHFVPQKYDALRKVPAYSRYIKERFLRCLDLYLCPRAIKMRLLIEPEDLVPKLPSPRDLQPFPTVLSINYEGHTDMVRTISPDKTGQYLVSGSDDCTVKIWEVNTGRCIKTIPVEGTVRSVEWCPNGAISLILIAANNRVILINPKVGDFMIHEKTDEILKEAPKSEIIDPERVKTAVQWEDPTDEEFEKGFRLVIKHFKEVAQVTWHGKGDYFATVMPEGLNRSVVISQLSKRRSQLPFSKAKGLVQSVLFHPTQPILFVATQRHVRVYDLVKQMLVKKLTSNSKWISKMAVHSGGDNLLVATYDRKILWFDLELSTKPYMTLRLHGTAVRSVAFHKRYPLFASGSDDRNVIISHGMVYNDLLKNALIVPLKRLQDHRSSNDFGVFDVKFHPLQPWVFSSGADGTIKLYCN